MSTPGMFEAEANDPGYVYRHGWVTLGCPDCGEFIYDGRWMPPEDREEMKRIHRVACTSPAGGSTP